MTLEYRAGSKELYFSCNDFICFGESPLELRGIYLVIIFVITLKSYLQLSFEKCLDILNLSPATFFITFYSLQCEFSFFHFCL